MHITIATSQTNVRFKYMSMRAVVVVAVFFRLSSLHSVSVVRAYTPFAAEIVQFDARDKPTVSAVEHINTGNASLIWPNSVIQPSL